MMSVCLPDAGYYHQLEAGPSPPVEGWLHTLHLIGRETNISQETIIDSQSTRMCSPNEKGGTVGQPPRCHPVHWVEQASKITPIKC